MEELERNRAIVTQAYSGPLPQASEFEKYENVLKGSADRILTMAENQARHRQELEKAVVFGNQKKSFWGLVLGFVIGCIGIISGALLVYYDKTYQGLGLSGGTIVSLVYVFIYGSNQQRRERRERELELRPER